MESKGPYWFGGDFPVNAFNGYCVEIFKITLLRCNNNPHHLNDGWTDCGPVLAMPEKGVRTVFTSWKNKNPPCSVPEESGHVHHGFARLGKAVLKEVHAMFQNRDD